MKPTLSPRNAVTFVRLNFGIPRNAKHTVGEYASWQTVEQQHRIYSQLRALAIGAARYSPEIGFRDEDKTLLFVASGPVRIELGFE